MTGALTSATGVSVQAGPALLSHARLLFWAHSVLRLVRPPGVWLIAPMLAVMSAPVREDRGTLRLATGIALALAGPLLTHSLTEHGTVHAVDTGPALLTSVAVLVAASVAGHGRARWWLLVVAESVAVLGCWVCELLVGVPVLSVAASALWGTLSAAAAAPLARGLRRLSAALVQRRRAVR